MTQACPGSRGTESYFSGVCLVVVVGGGVTASKLTVKQSRICHPNSFHAEVSTLRAKCAPHSAVLSCSSLIRSGLYSPNPHGMFGLMLHLQGLIPNMRTHPHAHAHSYTGLCCYLGKDIAPTSILRTAWSKPSTSAHLLSEQRWDITKVQTVWYESRTHTVSWGFTAALILDGSKSKFTLCVSSVSLTNTSLS